MDYLKPKPTIRNRRTQARHVAKASRTNGPPRRKLYLATAHPCSVCTIIGSCPVPAHEIQLPLVCGKHLMSKHRTWACPYNVKSWCCYTRQDTTCFFLDAALDGEFHQEVLEYRDLEQRYWEAMDSRYPSRARAVTMLHRMTQASTKLLKTVGEHRLTVCAFYSLYKKRDREAIVNRTDMEIPKLLASEATRLKGQKDRRSDPQTYPV